MLGLITRRDRGRDGGMEEWREKKGKGEGEGKNQPLFGHSGTYFSFQHSGGSSPGVQSQFIVRQSLKRKSSVFGFKPLRGGRSHERREYICL